MTRPTRIGVIVDGMTIARWQAEALETAAAEARMPVTACRSFAQWDEHPQARAIAGLPLFGIDQIGDAPPEPLPPADRPLAGV